MDRSWVSEVVPAQILRLGSLALAGVPGEPTTVAGRRLVQTLRTALAPHGVRDIVVAPYANAYVGYVTTREEYLCQHYEGASTLYGPWTLAMWQTVFAELATGSLAQRHWVPGPAPITMPIDLLIREREVGRRALGRDAPLIAGQSLSRVFHGPTQDMHTSSSLSPTPGRIRGTASVDRLGVVRRDFSLPLEEGRKMGMLVRG